MKRTAIALLAVVVTLLAGGTTASAAPTPPGTGIRTAPVAAPPSVPSVGPALVDAALAASGTVVRTAPGVTVTRVVVPGKGGVPTTLYRVRVAGRFPPRALRYVVRSGGTPVGYGIPTPSGLAVEAVTRSTAPLSADVTAGPEITLPTGPAGPSTPVPTAAERQLPNGPLAVARAEYDFGDQAWRPPGLRGKVEMRADVHYPKGLPGGPYPLVMFLHGNHATCFKGSHADFRWPCRPGWKPIPNYRGYDYIASRLASFGFVVVSISTNGVNVLGSRFDDTGMRQRGELVERHIDLWRRWTTVGGGPFGNRFAGKIDLTRIGTMGHSRGGEGVVWNTVVDRERAHPYGIKAVFAIAPVDFTRQLITDVPFAVVLPYCDGDVSDLEGVHFFDDSRYAVPGDPTPKATVTVMGANHNFFNTIWTPGSGYPDAFDEGAPLCDGRLHAGQERKVGSTYVVDFFRRYLQGVGSLDPVFTGAATPSGIAPAKTLISYLAPDTPDRRLDVDRFTSPNSMGMGALGPVTAKNLAVYGWCADTFDRTCVPGKRSFVDIHLPGLSQGVMGSSAFEEHRQQVRFTLPGTDVSGFDALQFRVGPNPGYATFLARGQRAVHLQVVLRDGAGHVAVVSSTSVGDAALVVRFGRFSHFILNQVRFPLSAFAGVDFTDVTSIEVLLPRNGASVLDVADMNFTAGG
ncbi:MAG TPA: hypothetical protein VNN79_01655 [Actinomycetota bacterium]|nr:hypothetical protein [Actinomycetota bacterium]